MLVKCFIVSLLFRSVFSADYGFLTQKIAIIKDFFNIHDASDGDQCREIFKLMVNNIEQMDVFHFFDSWGKIPSGLAWGHLTDMGNFDECIQAKTKLGDYLPVHGKYCLAKAGTGQLSLGVCLSHICHTNQMEAIVNEIYNKHFEIEFKIDENDCSTAEPKQLNGIDIFTICLLSVIIVTIAASTLYDIVTRIMKIRPKELLLSFSICYNGKKLFRINGRKSKDSIDCVHGIRVLSMVWIVYAHTYTWDEYLPMMNTIEVHSWFHTFYSMVLRNSTYAVDTFLFLSGLLLCWVTFKQMNRTNGKLNIPFMYLHRFLRLTPLVAITIIFVLSIFKFLGSGPMWSTFVELSKAGCEENWWKTILYVQNYAARHNMCLSHTWYLAVDTQLYVLSPLILIPLWKWGWKFVPALAVLALLSMGCVIATFYTYDIREVVGTPVGVSDRMLYTYLPTHTRYTPWLIGICLGYYLFTIRGKPVQMPKILVIIGWILSAAIMLLVIFGPYRTVQADFQASILEGALYESLSRPGWTIAIAWIVFACTTGYGGAVNSILSYSFWQPISRLSYCIYIVHVLAQVVNAGLVRTAVHFSDYEVILQFWGAFGLAVVVSIIIVIAIEVPILTLEGLILRKRIAARKEEPFEVEITAQDTPECSTQVENTSA